MLRDAFTPVGGRLGRRAVPVPVGEPRLLRRRGLNPRFTNTLDGGTGTLVPEAGTLKGRIAPSAVITEGGEKIGIVGATTQLLEAISSPDRHRGRRASRPAPGANGEVDDMVLLAQQLQPIIDELIAEGVNKIILQSHLQQIANEQLLATLLQRRRHHPGGGLQHPARRRRRRAGGLPGP